MIKINALSKTFSSRDISHKALDNINLEIEDGDIIGIIGQSGAGKSTLVRCINLLETPDEGSILIDGVDLGKVDRKELLQKRQSIGMVFQNFALFSQRTVLQNVEFPLSLNKVSKKESEKVALKLLDKVGILDKKDEYPTRLSGGQKQRVAIARALANNPDVLLCDEPTSALDLFTENQILDLLKQINEELGVTVIIITHSLQVVKRICNKVAVIDRGKIVETGKCEDVLISPKSPVTKALVALDNVNTDPSKCVSEVC